MSDNSNKDQVTSALAIAGLVFAFLFSPLGGILSLIALVKILKNPDALSGKGLAIAGLVVSGISLVVIVLMAAVAIPNFLNFQCRAMQSESKMQLNMFKVAEESYHAEKDRYGSLEELQTSGGLSLDTLGARYKFSVEASKDAFQVKALGIADRVKGDVWVITNKSPLRNENNVCE